MTEYVVLRFQKIMQDGSSIHSGAWVELGRADGRSSASAIRTVVDSREEPFIEDELVAVPTRSWKPVTVKVETKTALKFS